MRLDWNPQPAFKPYFNDYKSVLKRRTVFRPDYDNFVARGGRGSGKTMTFADAVVIEASLRPVRVLATRELQNSIEESVKAEIDAAIVSRGLEWFFDIKKTEIVGLNGSKFIFKGLKNNITSIKSITDVEIVLCEESESIPRNSWDKLLPSIRPRSGRPIVIVIYNPDEELDDTHQRWAINPPSRTISLEINWKDNIYFPAFLNRQRMDCLRMRPQRDYDHIWEGKPTGANLNVIIPLEWVMAARFASKKWEAKNGPWPDGEVIAGYDPAGEGKDNHARGINDSHRIVDLDEWPLSPDLREASDRAFNDSLPFGIDRFHYDTCGGLGDGVAVFVNDANKAHHKRNVNSDIEIEPVNAGATPDRQEEEITGTTITNGQTYVNLKAQMQGETAQLLYSAYRFVTLGHEVEAHDMLSIDIADDEMFLKLAKELSAPVWVKSKVNSKKQVEDKAAMKKRTGHK